MNSFLDNLLSRRAGREPPPLPISIKTTDLGLGFLAQSSISSPSSTGTTAARNSTDEKMSAKHHGLGILDSKDWDEVKDLDWDEKASLAWKPSLGDWKPAPPKLLNSPKAGWALRRLKSVVWPKSKCAGAPAEGQLRKTAYLDGLRGFAAFLVYWQHHELWAHGPADSRIMENSFGFEGKYSLASFPGVRLMFNGGHFAVATFFVISGYVLSTKPLSLIQSGEQAKLAENLGSALFRRWLRLYPPLFCTTFLYMLTWHAFGGLWIDGAKKQGSMREELWMWYVDLKNFSFVFNAGGEPWPRYNYHLWSIPVEMKGSIVVFTSLLAFSRATTKARLWCLAGLMYYFMYICDGWYCCLFLLGTFLADLDLLAAKKQLPRFLQRLSPYKEFIYYHLLVIAIYLGGIPSQTTEIEALRGNRGWYYLSFLKPQAVFDYKWFYLFFASGFLISATPRIAWMKRFFETRFCQYLGRISYALYLIHGPVLWIVGDRIYSAVGWADANVDAKRRENIPQWVDRFPLPMAGPLGLEMSFLLPHLVLLPVTFWCAEMVTRLFDEPAVKFAQWFYRQTLAPAGGAGPGPGPGPGSGAGSSSSAGGTPPPQLPASKKLDGFIE